MARKCLSIYAMGSIWVCGYGWGGRSIYRGGASDFCWGSVEISLCFNSASELGDGEVMMGTCRVVQPAR